MSARGRLTRRTFAGGASAAGLAVAGTTRSRVNARQASGEITFMNWDTIDGTPLEAAIKAFEADSGITVNVQPAPTQDYETKMRTLLASGSPPDVMRINDDFVRGYSLANQLMDLRPFIEESGLDPNQYFEHPWNFPVQPGGEHTAWAIGVQPALIFYNKTMFEEAGVALPPTTWSSEGWTWDDFLATAQALTVPDERWGALVVDDTSHETIFTVNNGEPTGIYSEDGTEFTLANPNAIEGIQWVADLTCEHEVQPPWSELQQDNAGNQLFAAGRIAMIERTFGVTSYLQQNVSDFEWDVAPVPGKADQQTIATLIVFTIPQDASNPEAAWELLNYLGGVEGGAIFAESRNFIPVNQEAAELIKSSELPPEHIDIVLEAAQHATNENFSQNIERARQIYRPQLDLVYNCDQSAEEVLTGLREQVEDALAGDI